MRGYVSVLVFLCFLDLNWFNKASGYGFCETFANGLVFDLDSRQVIGALAGYVRCFLLSGMRFEMCFDNLCSSGQV